MCTGTSTHTCVSVHVEEDERVMQGVCHEREWDVRVKMCEHVCEREG